MGAREQFQQAVRDLIEQQPAARETFDRLVTGGLSPAEARRLIIRVVVEQISEDLRLRQDFDTTAFAAALSGLEARRERIMA